MPCELTLDPNTVNCNLSLSKDNRKVTEVLEQLPYPEHPERFHHWKQLLCREILTGRSYWEEEWKGGLISELPTKESKEKGRMMTAWIGQNDKPWSVCDNKFSACHKNRRVATFIQSSFNCGRVECTWTGLLVICPSTESPLTQWSTSTPSTAHSLNLSILHLDLSQSVTHQFLCVRYSTR